MFDVINIFCDRNSQNNGLYAFEMHFSEKLHKKRRKNIGSGCSAYNLYNRRLDTEKIRTVLKPSSLPRVNKGRVNMYLQDLNQMY